MFRLHLRSGAILYRLRCRKRKDRCCVRTQSSSHRARTAEPFPRQACCSGDARRRDRREQARRRQHLSPRRRDRAHGFFRCRRACTTGGMPNPHGRSSEGWAGDTSLPTSRPRVNIYHLHCQAEELGVLEDFFDALPDGHVKDSAHKSYLVGTLV